MNEDYAGLIQEISDEAEWFVGEPPMRLYAAEMRDTFTILRRAANAITTLTQGAKRYQKLKSLYTCIDLEYGDSSEGTTPSIVFAIPPGTKWSGDLDASIDAMEKQMNDTSVPLVNGGASTTASGPVRAYASLGCILAMRVMQSDLYPLLDDVERAECDELVAMWCGIVKQQAKNEVDGTAPETSTRSANE